MVIQRNEPPLVCWALRGGLRDVALSLAHERLGTRPRSVVNRRFLDEAERLAS